MPFILDADLKTSLAASLKLASVSDLPASWADVITKSNNAAYQDIAGALSGRGFTPAQIAAWDRAVEFNTDLGLFWCLVKGAGLHGNDPTFINKLDRRAELKSIEVMIGGVLTYPGLTSPSVVGYGNLDTSADRYNGQTKW